MSARNNASICINLFIFVTLFYYFTVRLLNWILILQLLLLLFLCVYPHVFACTYFVKECPYIPFFKFIAIHNPLYHRPLFSHWRYITLRTTIIFLNAFSLDCFPHFSSHYVCLQFLIHPTSLLNIHAIKWFQSLCLLESATNLGGSVIASIGGSASEAPGMDGIGFYIIG